MSTGESSETPPIVGIPHQLYWEWADIPATCVSLGCGRFVWQRLLTASVGSAGYAVSVALPGTSFVALFLHLGVVAFAQ